MVRTVRTLVVIIAGASIAFVIAACRDIDEPPPLPVFDPDATIDGGADSAVDGGLAENTVLFRKPSSWIHPC